MHHRQYTRRERLQSLILSFLTLGWGACIPSAPLPAKPGFREVRRPGFVEVPGGHVNTAGGNLLLSRVDLSVDTLIGTQEIAAVYNSSSGEWLWNFQIQYDGTHFVDTTGAVYHDVSPAGDLLTPNGTLRGTQWMRVDANTLRTRGGLEYRFETDGRLAAISWAGIAYPRLEFDADRIWQCSLATTCLPLFDLALNADGDPLMLTDARSGRSATFAYDAQGRLSVARSPRDVAQGAPGTRYEYQADATLTALTRPDGERIEYEYQAGRRVLHVTQLGEGNPRHRFEFYAWDAALKRWPNVHVNPLGGTTRFLYDDALRLREVERTQSGELTRIGYGGGSLAAAHRPNRITTPSGAVTRFDVDANDDVVLIVEPSGNVVSVGYAPGALSPSQPLERPRQRIEDSIGLISETTHATDGLPVQVDLPEGEIASATWQGAVLQTLTDPFGTTTRYEGYGIHGHWIEATVPGTAFPLRRAFDQVGNLLVSAAGLQEGGVLDRSYDENRLVKRIHVAATTGGLVTSEDDISLQRRSDGKLVSVQRPLGADHQFVYDALGRLASVRERVDGLWQETHFEYDAAGNVTARERPNGMREELGYDVYGRLTRRAALRDGVFEGEALITWANGLPVAFWDSKRGGEESYAYDQADRLAAVSYPAGELASVEYDARGRVTRIVYSVPGQLDHSVAYEYDVADRQTRVTLDDVETLVELSYANGKQVSVRYGNGLERAAHYDAESGRLTGFVTREAFGSTIASSDVTRTVHSERFLTSSVTQTTLGTTAEHYSMGLAGLLGDVNRRVGNRVWGWQDDAGNSKTYIYDGLSNLLSNSDGDSFAYNAERNRLQSATLAHEATTVSYSYDDAGFVTSRNGAPLSWTATGRLSSYAGVSIEWDMADRPMAMTIAGQVYALGRFGGAVETDPQSGAIAALDPGIVRIHFGTGQRRYRHKDFRGNVSFVSDEAGNVVAHYRYSAYGLDAVLGTESDAQRFAGRLEAGDGLVLMGARIYDQLSGRFLSQDPVFQELNQYSYTFGNPLDFWDPDGAQQAPSDATAEVAAAGFAAAAAVIGFAVAVSVAAGVPLTTGLALFALLGATFALASVGISLGLALRRKQQSAGSGASGIEAAPGSSLCEGGCGPGFPSPPPTNLPGTACAPTNLALVPNLAPLLLVLLPLQLILAAAVLRHRRRAR